MPPAEHPIHRPPGEPNSPLQHLYERDALIETVVGQQRDLNVDEGLLRQLESLDGVGQARAGSAVSSAPISIAGTSRQVAILSTPIARLANISQAGHTPAASTWVGTWVTTWNTGLRAFREHVVEPIRRELYLDDEPIEDREQAMASFLESGRQTAPQRPVRWHIHGVVSSGSTGSEWSMSENEKEQAEQLALTTRGRLALKQRRLKGIGVRRPIILNARFREEHMYDGPLTDDRTGPKVFDPRHNAWLETLFGWRAGHILHLYQNDEDLVFRVRGAINEALEEDIFGESIDVLIHPEFPLIFSYRFFEWMKGLTDLEDSLFIFHINEAVMGSQRRLLNQAIHDIRPKPSLPKYAAIEAAPPPYHEVDREPSHEANHRRVSVKPDDRLLLPSQRWRVFQPPFDPNGDRTSRYPGARFFPPSHLLPRPNANGMSNLNLRPYNSDTDSADSDPQTGAENSPEGAEDGHAEE